MKYLICFKEEYIYCYIIIVINVFFLISPNSLFGQSVYEIIERHTLAIGGKRIDSIKTVYYEGTSTSGLLNKTYVVKEYRAYPNLIRYQTTSDSNTVYACFDGFKDCLRSIPDKPIMNYIQKYRPKKINNMESPIIDGLVNLSKSDTVKLVEKIGEIDYVILVKNKTYTILYYVNKKNYLLIKQEIFENDTDILSVKIFADFQWNNGILLPSSTELTTFFNGHTVVHSKNQYSSIIVNMPMDYELFKCPD